jgi:hypothetical protein
MDKANKGDGIRKTLLITLKSNTKKYKYKTSIHEPELLLFYLLLPSFIN